MDHRIELEASFTNVSVLLATVHWGPADKISPAHTAHCLCQRLSGSQAPLRIQNQRPHEALPHVHSVGFLPPGRSVGLFPVDTPFRLLVCSFETDYFESTTAISRDHWDRHTGSLVSIRNQRLEMLMQEIHAELEQPGFGQHLVIEAASTLMLVELARYARELDRKSTRSGDSLALAPWQLRRIRERIDASLEVGYPGLQELAELCGVSQSHLMRSFKASTGWQIHKYIAAERLKTAKAMLAQDQYSCQQVATLLGFGSQAYFATAFRRMTGKTPTEYRRQVLAQGSSDGGPPLAD